MDMILTCSIFYDLSTWWCLANINVLLPGILDREIKVPGHPGRVTLGQSVGRDLPVSSVAIRV